MNHLTLARPHLSRRARAIWIGLVALLGFGAAGMVLAVEPMITLGSPENVTLPDAWTVVTMDGSLAAHWEHTVAVTSTGPWVLTAHDGGAAEFAALGVSVSAMNG